jgi:hypothetical protein
MMNASEIKDLLAKLGSLVQINIFIGSEVATTPSRPEGGPLPSQPDTGSPPVQSNAQNLAKALRLTIKILMENLDTETLLEAIIRVGAGEIARQTVMRGEKPEFFTGRAEIVLSREVNIVNERLTFELNHPGTPSNEQPHVRLQITDLALVMADGSIRGASINMEESLIFTDKHHEEFPPGHWNFVNGDRSSGQVIIHVT